MRTALVGQGYLEKHADDPAIRQRFVAEAEITGGLEHPGGE
jgi:eukaryotic-like serine/threonine-protein kinase